MPKRSDSYYLQNLIECVECGCQAAEMLEGDLNHFNIGLLQDELDELHRIKHDVDRKKHKMMAVLVKVLITPIEREGIILLNRSIDEVTDKIEDVLIRTYINNVQQIRPEALTFIKIIIRYCETLKEVMGEFADLRKSKTLHGLIIEINALEEEGDNLFVDSVRSLHAEATGPIEVVAWGKIYVYLEKCYDAREHVADVVESMIMRDTWCPAATVSAWEVRPTGHMVLTDKFKSWKSLIFTV